MNLEKLSDAGLLAKAAIAYAKAKDAPSALLSDSWARFAREWQTLDAEIKRRGLKP